MQTDPLLSTFDFPNVDRVKIGFFCQLFLTHPGAFAKMANGFAKNSSLLMCPQHENVTEQ